MEIRKFARKQFEVEAVLVTEENMEEVASWCGGKVIPAKGHSDSVGAVHVRVPAHRPLNRKQTQGFVGNWVLKSPTGFKVYTDPALWKNFDDEGPSENLFDKPRIEMEEPEPEPYQKQQMSEFFSRRGE